MLSELEQKYKGETCYIIGKGPSVQYLDESYFPTNGPVIPINETYEKVESLNIPNPVYSLQKDIGFGVPKKATLLVHCWEDSSQFAKDYTPRIEFNCNDFGLNRNTFSAIVALKFSQLFGCKEVKLISFDSCTIKDYRTQNFDKVIFIPYCNKSYHHQYIAQEAFIFTHNLNVEYITPGLKEGLIEILDNEKSLMCFC